MVIHNVCHNQLKQILCCYSFYKMMNKVTVLKNVPLKFGMKELQYNLRFSAWERTEYTVISGLAKARLELV